MQRLISGVKHAYEQAPTSLDTAQLPAFINLTGPGNDDWAGLGDGQEQNTRIYVMRLYILPVSSGIPGEVERLCEPFFESVRLYFAQRPTLGGLARVQSAYILSDSGVVKLPFKSADPEFLGTEFRLQVTEVISFNYAE